MDIPKKECVHVAQVLEKAKSALSNKKALELKELSNQTIHSACSHQDAESIIIATMLYALGKIIEREDYKKIREWDSFVKKFNAVLDLAISSLNEQNQTLYQKYITQARQLITSESVNLKQYIEDVLKKASLNKGSKIYEHGVSREQAAKLLGVSQWELSPYIGQSSKPEQKQEQTIDVKQRAKMALEFFS